MQPPSTPTFQSFLQDHIHQSAEPCTQMFGICEKQYVNIWIGEFFSTQCYGHNRVLEWKGKGCCSCHLLLENQLPLFTGNIINSLLSSGESLFPKLILPPTQTQHRQKSNQNLAEADAMLRKPSSNLRYEETVPVLWGSRVESWLMQTHLGGK